MTQKRNGDYKPRPRVTFVTRHFERSHGRKPAGDGAWAFCTTTPGSPGYLEHCIWARGEYRACKRAIEKTAVERGIALLYVCP